MARRRPNGLDALLAEWGALTRLEQEGRAVEWPPHQLPITLAVMRMPPNLRRVLETRFAGPPGSSYNRPTLAEMSHTVFHAKLGSARAFVEGYLSAGQERDQGDRLNRA
jgi:hypothetical protein